MNYYEALEVPSTASADVINDQYQILANKWHPDKNRGNTAAAERFKLIGEAYQSLTG
ncbi:DnaJ domain-containing protein [Cantharellus anzutake]|uniref:DnaJ domain-containing protein n=1 Tax=Cantharellus anzutake TaxID=1750568 RepID=UPI001902F4D9|nr:DnaJ domain-containing protein [Cantharellus anzutake]KAF8322005.1 DnaJ domain-containing protein [Cantharellus anzutake]